MNYLDVEQKRTYVKGLALQCPMGESVNGCPMTDIRLLTVKEKMNAVNAMAVNTILEIINYHNDCLARRTDFPAMNN